MNMHARVAAVETQELVNALATKMMQEVSYKPTEPNPADSLLGMYFSRTGPRFGV